IEKIQISIPVSNIKSKPSKIEITNIFVLVSPKPFKEWNLEQLNTISYKQQIIDQAIKSFIEEKQKQEQNKQSLYGESIQDKGKLSRLIAVVLDNIEISIKNVHFRFETNSSPFYAWGITIGSIDIVTMSQDWAQKQFMDRATQGNKSESINKKLSFTNVGFYWNNQKQADLFGNLSAEVVVEKMYEYILQYAQVDDEDYNFHFKSLKSPQYIICLNVDAHLTMNFKTMNWQIPEFSVIVDFLNVNIKINNKQLKDMLSMVNFFNYYQYQMKLEKNKRKLRIPTPDLQLIKGIRCEIQRLQDTNYQYNIEKIDQLEKEVKNLWKDVWIFAINKQRQIHMEKKYKQILIQILNSKYNNIEKLVSIEACNKLIYSKTLSENEVIRYLRIIRRNDFEELLRWSKIAQEQIDQNRIKSKSNKQKWSLLPKKWSKKDTEQKLDKNQTFIKNQIQKNIKIYQNSQIIQGQKNMYG
ncbi:hypothetical protein IMG5_181120, partial [Ichthyophthirius multifiliis]